MTEQEYKAAIERIEQIKYELEKLRIEKTKLIQATYYYENRDRLLKKHYAKKDNNSTNKH